MTTLERARRFFQRIDWWSGSNSYRPGFPEGDFMEWTAPRLWCQSRVARALIRQELRYRRVLDSRRSEGLQDALNIIDAVYGREGQ